MRGVAAVVLAGGASKRMGRDKASLVFQGAPLLQRVVDVVSSVAEEVVIATAPHQHLPEFNRAPYVRVEADRAAGEGPLVGLVSALATVLMPVSLIVACDLPFLQPGLLRLLAERTAEHAAVIPVLRGGGPQPQCSAIRTETLELMQEGVDRGERALSMITRLPGALFLGPGEWLLSDPRALSFVGVNTPDDLLCADRIASTEEA